MIDFKKIIGVTAAGAMLMGTVACGNKTENKSSSSGDSVTDVTLTVWTPQEDQEKQDGQSESWLAAEEAAFEKAHKEYKITWKNATVSEGDAGEQMKTDPSAGADVFLFANDQLGTLIDSKAIAELPDSSVEQIKKDNDEEMVESVTGADGNLYGIPFSGNTWFMYYNKAKVSEDDAKSLDTMLEKAKVSFPLNDSWYIPSFYIGAGATIFGEKGTDASAKVNLGDNAGDVTKYLVDLKNNSNFVLDDGASGLAGIKNGNVDVLFSGAWNAADVKAALGDNFGVAKLPTYTLNGKETQLKSFAGSKAVGYNPNSKNTKAASQFAAFLGSSDAQKDHYKLRNSSVIPASKSLVSSDSDLKSDPVVVAQNETIAQTSILQPTIAAMSSWWDPCETFGKNITSGVVTKENADSKTNEWQDLVNSSMN